VVDLSPYCTQLQQSGADAAISLMSGVLLSQMVSTCEQRGVKGITWMATQLGMTPAAMDGFAKLEKPPIVVLTFDGPALETMSAQFKKYGDKFGKIVDTSSGPVLNTWLAITTAAEVFKQLPTISGPAMQEYLNKQNAFQTGATRPLDFTKPGAFATFPRLANTFGKPGTVKGGKFVATGDFYTLVGT
jgi:ABC-type branched-subunit amino acid transport system substrate-binding protein